MDQYCVVLCGLQAGASDETSAWQPVAAALKLDHAEFERRVVAALPRIVRRELDQATAERIAEVLQALHVDARVLPDDPQLVYIGRAGASCGPLPQSSLDDFIRPGESFRLRGSATWQPWPEPVDQITTPAVELDDAPTLSPVPGEEPIDTVATADTSHEVSDATWAAVPSAIDDELHDALSSAPTARQESTPVLPEGWRATETAAEVRESARRDDFIPDDLISNDAIEAIPSTDNDETDGAMPPPLGTASTTQPEPPEEAEAIAPATDAAESAHEEDLLDPAGETTATSPDAASAVTPAVVETRPPARSGRARLVVLLVLVALAIWAYRHWMADTRTDGAPAAPAVIQPTHAAAGKSATSATAPAAALPPATSSAAPAGTVAAPTAATSTPAPAASTPGAAPATSTPAAAGPTSSAAPATTPAPAPSTGTAAATRAR